MGIIKNNKFYLLIMKLLILLSISTYGMSLPPWIVSPVLPTIPPMPVVKPCYTKRAEDIEFAKNGFVPDFFPVQCQSQNDVLYAAKRYHWYGTCSCIDPLTGKTLTENADCDQPCLSEPGNTCKEKKGKRFRNDTLSLYPRFCPY